MTPGSASQQLAKFDEQRLRQYLRLAVEDFATDNIAAVNIRHFAERLPDLLVSEGILLLLESTPSTEGPGLRYLCTQLLKQPSLFRILTDPWRYSVPEAVNLARRLLSVDRTLDIRLARCLPGRTQAQGYTGGAYAPGLCELDGAMAERALDILDEISVGRRVVPIVNHLVRHPDPRLSAKSVLLVGRRIQNLNWARRLLEECKDARVRANAIESIWGSDSKPAVQLFRSTLSDHHCRVVGNSVVGLHLARQPEVRRIVRKLAGDAKPEMRQTTAWTMGKIADPEFAPDLSLLVKDADPGVRGAALRALLDIRQAERWLEQNAPDRPQIIEPEQPLIVVEPEPVVYAVGSWLDGSNL